jgi:ribosome biogenesis GTPase
VVKVAGGKSLVASLGQIYVCDLRGKLFRREGVRLAVGDGVEFTPAGDGHSDDEDDAQGEAPLEGVIEAVHERRTALRRVRDFKRDQVVCANVDRVFVVTAVLDPPYKRSFIDRVIVAAERDHLEPFLVFNKLDLADPEYAAFVATDAQIYADLGYPILLLSAAEGRGVAELSEAFQGRISVVVGPSGVGKSTLLNAICPGLALRTGEVSQSDGRGRHTTTAAELVSLPRVEGREQGYVVDTPGLRGFGLWDLEPSSVAQGYREIAAHSAGCKFRDCLHRVEPQCAVRAAVEAGDIDEERFDSYLHLVDELKAKPAGRQATRRR